MIIAACRLTLHLSGNRTLKGKRQIVKRICERVRSRFHVSIGEVDELERHQQACLGIALVGNDPRVLQSVLDRILQSIDQMQLALVFDRQIEFIQYDRSLLDERPLVKFDDDDEDEYDLIHDDDSSIPDSPWAEDEDDAQPKHQGWAFLDEWGD